MHIDVSPRALHFGVRSVGRFVTIGGLASSRRALLAGASLILALALGAPDQAIAACGTTMPTGAHAPSSGAGGVHAGATTPHVSSSSGGTSCSTTTSGNPTPLAGVHEPGEAPRHVRLAVVHPPTLNTSISSHSPVRPTTNRTLPKP
jgi:hypothetical protein